MPRRTQPRQPRAARGVTLVNPEGSVDEIVPNMFVAHEPLMEGVSWEEHMRRIEDANPDGVVLDMDAIMASDRPIHTLVTMMREKAPHCPTAQLMMHVEVISEIVKHNIEQRHQQSMREMEERHRELDRQLEERKRELEGRVREQRVGDDIATVENLRVESDTD